MNKAVEKQLAEALSMRDTIVESLEDAKAIDIKVHDVRNLTDITDYMVVATGTSDRHVKTISDRVLEFMDKKSWQPNGIEGELEKDWVLVDYVDVVVHVMRSKSRQHYDLDSLWDETFSNLNRSANKPQGDAAIDSIN